MSAILLALGIGITAAGAIAVGFGFWFNALSVGPALIAAGATALANGLILVALAAAVTELTRIAEALRPRLPNRGARAADGKLKAGAAAGDVLVEVRQPPIPRPAESRPVEMRPPDSRPAENRPSDMRQPEPRPAESRPAEPRPPEARPAAENQLEVSASAIERLRSSLPRTERPTERPKADVVAATESVPMANVPPSSPPLPTSPNGANGAHHAGEPPPPAMAAATAAAKANGAAPPDTGGEGMKPRLDFLFRAKGARPGQPENFDALWPKRPGPAKGGAPPPRQQNMEPSPGPSGGDRAAAGEGQFSPPQPSPPPAQPAPPMQHAPSPRPEEQRSVGILKSGVVDGMAYTLYTDGSIEAQLPQGTVRFGSIAELRAHIENNP